MSDLFENLAAMDDSHIIAQRKASAVALKRVKNRFESFLANAGSDLPARMALVADDLTAIVNDVVEEYGGDAKKIEAAIKRSMLPVAPQGTMAPQAQGMGTMQGQPGQQQGQTCPQCGGPMVNGQCPSCQAGGAAGGAGGPGAGMAFGLNHTMPQSPSTGPITAAGGFCDSCHAWKSGPKAGCTCDGDEKSEDEGDDKSDSSDKDEKTPFESAVHTARRPMMCPYHSEVTDIALGSGDPQAGFNSMSAHAWGDKHCKGGFEGTCNFRPAMVTQKYWDDKQAEYEDRRQERDLQADPLTTNELSIDTEPIMHAEPLPDEPGEEGVSDIDGELANAPSAVGAGELAMAASTKKAEALKTVKLPKGGESALGGPSPKIDKGKSGDQNGWTLEPIDTQMKGSPNPTVEQDPTSKPDYAKEDFRAQTEAVSKQETLPANSGDAGFNTDRNNALQPTKTFGDNGTDPVTRTSISAVDPDKNPLTEILDEYEGFLMPTQVESALKSWTVG